MKKRFFIAVVGIVICLSLYLEIKPWQVCYSQVMTTSQQTEVELHVIMNTMMPVNQKEMAADVVSENRTINGWKEDCQFTVRFYRTKMHYKLNKEQDTVIFDEKRAGK